MTTLIVTLQTLGTKLNATFDNISDKLKQVRQSAPQSERLRLWPEPFRL
jgi:hypothetical protein